MSCSFPSLAVTPDELKTEFSESYAAGTRSVYGVSLTQDQLNAVASAVADFKNTYIKDEMSEEEKIRTIHSFLCDTVSFASSWKEHSANTAYGALVNHTAQCSGFARAFKALCDASGIECYYVHADENAINPSHQWNIVRYGDQYYHMDVQVNALGEDALYLSNYHPCSYNTDMYPQISSNNANVKRYAAGDGPYKK